MTELLTEYENLNVIFHKNQYKYWENRIKIVQLIEET
jgi:hypothetical protein